MKSNRNWQRKCSFAGALLALGLVGATPAGAESATAVTADCVHAPKELLASAWTYVPEASCGTAQFGTVNGNELSFAAGGYCSGGNGVPFAGFTYEQPVDVEAGRTYDLTLTLSNFNGWLDFIPTTFTITIAGVTQTVSATSAESVDLTFAIGALPPGPTTITINVRPPAGGVGPVNGGIYLTEEGVTAELSLVRVHTH